MRVVIQRVNHAAVRIDGETVGQIQKGLLLLVGLAEGDGEEQVVKAADKIAKMRIFEDEAGKTNLGIKDVGGQILSVSQFTLLADTKRETGQVLSTPCGRLSPASSGKNLTRSWLSGA